MAACRRCGKDNAAEAQFCSACGSPLVPEATRREARKTVTILFADVSDSTGLGERLDPEPFRQVMTRYFEEMRAVLERHGGTVEKFIGDAVMAVFGAPLLHEDDAVRALRAAAEMRETLAGLNDELERSFGVRIEIRTGVNSGEVIAGDAARRHAFISGDAVNVAERMERIAAPGEILIGESTYRLARDAIRVEPLRPLPLKGKGDKVTVYRLLEVRPGAPAHARRFDSPMVGRGRELRLLQDAFAHSVRDDACHLFTVLGSAGVGKSRLVAEALREIEGIATVLRGSCLPYGEGITFWPVMEVVKQATGISEEDSLEEARAKIASRLAGEAAAPLISERVAEVLGLTEGSAPTEEGFWGLRKLLEALARQRPLVVVFDDVNWAEPTFLDLVEHIADWSRDSPILLICMARPELLDARPSWGGGKLNATSILLEPLTESESTRLIHNLLGKAALAENVRARIQAPAEGNPLFVEEMLAMLIDDGLLQRENGHWTATGDLSAVRVPPTIQILLASRLDRLNEDERRVIEQASVEGKVFHRGAVEVLSPAAVRDRTGACLMALVRKELIRSDSPTFAGEDAFRFRHSLIRDAAYESLPKQVRSELHERYALWLEARAGEYEELVGYHLEQAVRYRAELGPLDEEGGRLAVRAGRLLAATGRRALGRGDMPAAANLLERAVSLLPEGEPGRSELLPYLGEALRETGNLTRADEVLSDAVAVAEAAGDRRLRSAALIRRSSLRLYTDPDLEGRTEELARVAAEAVRVFERFDDHLGLAEAWGLLAQVHWTKCRYAAMEEVLERALLHAERAADQQETASILSALARVALLGPTPVEEGLRRCVELLELARGDPPLEAVIGAMVAGLEAMRGRFQHAREQYAQSRAIFEEFGFAVRVAALPLYSGPVEMLAGNPEEAERQLRAGYERLAEMGDKGRLSPVAAFLARALEMQGIDEDAERFTDVSERTASRDDAFPQVVWRGTRAKILARRGELERAEILAREAVVLAGETDSINLQGDARMDLADVLAPAGSEETLALAREASRLYEAKGNIVSQKRALSILNEVANRA